MGELRAMMASGVSCVDVMLVFIHRAATLGRRCGAVAEENYDEALAQAAKYDALDRAASPWTDELRFPLLGVPLSVKDQVWFVHQHPAFQLRHIDTSVTV